MKKSSLLILCTIAILVSCVKESGYKEEELLFRYIQERQNNVFSDYDEFNLVLYTKDNNCGCHKTPYELDTIVETIVKILTFRQSLLLIQMKQH
jgi:predicted GTPase